MRVPKTARPLDAEQMRYGQGVAVFGIGYTHHHRTAQALSVTGPRGFGFDLDLIPLDRGRLTIVLSRAEIKSLDLL